MTAPESNQGSSSNEPEEEEEPTPSETTRSERVSGIIRNLPREERTRILFGVLFHRFTTPRGRTSSSQNIQRPVRDPERPLRMLSREDAIACNAVCRFCLGQANEEPQDESSTINNNPFVSPCNCSGGSEWVHVQCFRRWQSQASESMATEQAARICTVCRCTFQLPPRSIGNQSLLRGTLLVYMDEAEDRPSSFQKTLVLLLEHTDNNTYGLILNSMLEEHVEDIAMRSLSPYCTEGLSWRRGGPVCGGRLGVTTYSIAHTVTSLPQVEYGNQRLVSCPLISSPQGRENNATTTSHQDLQFIFDASNLRIPANFRGEELGSILERLTQNFERHCQGQQQTPSEPGCKFILFSGYCKWRGGQLQGEIQRGVWGVCNDTMVQDILRPTPWQEVRYSNRFQTHEELLEDEDTVIRNLVEEQAEGVPAGTGAE